jgi:flagellar hook-basal body complex protein FliE
MAEINPVISGLSGLSGITGPGAQPAAAPETGPGGLSFKAVVKDFLSDTNRAQLYADRMITKGISGEVNDVHSVMVAVTKAETSLRLMLEIRNRLMSAYQEVMRMQV